MSDTNPQPDFDDSLLSAYLDGELTATEKALVEQRLAQDPQARQLLAEFKSISTKVRDLPRAKLTGDLRSAVLDRLEQPKSTRSRSELSMPRRLLWPLLATATLVMLMVYQTEVEEEPIEVAQQQAGKDRVLAEAKRESTRKSAPTIGVLEALPEAEPSPSPRALEESIAREESIVDQLATAPPESRQLRSLAGEKVIDAPSGAPQSDGRAGSLSPAETSIALVHLTLNDFPSGAKQFDRLLAANGIQLVSDAKGSAESAATRVDTNSSSGVSLDFGGGGLDKSSAVEQSLSNEVELVLVEAPPEQLAQLLWACNQDNEAIESVTIDKPQETEGDEQLNLYRQFEKPARQPAAAQQFVVTPEQQGVIAALNSINSKKDAMEQPKKLAAPPESQMQQAWATRLRNYQVQLERKQLGDEVLTRRNQATYDADREQAKGKVRQGEKQADSSQHVRMLFLLHPRETTKK